MKKDSLDQLDKLEQLEQFFKVDERVADDAAQEIYEMIWERLKGNDFLTSFIFQRLENISVAVWRMVDEFEKSQNIARELLEIEVKKDV